MSKICLILRLVLLNIKGIIYYRGGKNPALIKNFKDDPVKTIESLSGIDIPDGMEDKVVAGVKTAMAKDAAGGVLDSVKKLF